MSAPAPPGTLRIAAAQYPIGKPATLADWRGGLDRWVAEGAATGADLLVFPEYGLMELAATFGAEVGADLQASLAAVASLAREVEAIHRDLARRHRVHILAASGPGARPEGGFVNVARLVTPMGAVGYAEKFIMTPFEVAWGVSPGNRPRVFETTLGRLAVAICYDSEFPLLARAQAEAGARVVLVPSCTERWSGATRVTVAARARALESQIATVVAPTIGEAPWSPAVDRNTGVAGIYVPAEAELCETGILAEGRRDAPGWTVATVDLAALERIRSTGEMRNSRDWDRQPGAVALAGGVEMVDLSGRG